MLSEKSAFFSSIHCLNSKCKSLKTNGIKPYLLLLFLLQIIGYKRIPWHCMHCKRGGGNTARNQEPVNRQNNGGQNDQHDADGEGTYLRDGTRGNAVVEKKDIVFMPSDYLDEKTDVSPSSSTPHLGQILEEGVGCAVALDKLLNFSGSSELCFRHLSPRLESGLNLAWKKNQLFPQRRSCFWTASGEGSAGKSLCAAEISCSRFSGIFFLHPP